MKTGIFYLLFLVHTQKFVPYLRQSINISALVADLPLQTVHVYFVVTYFWCCCKTVFDRVAEGNLGSSTPFCFH